MDFEVKFKLTLTFSWVIKIFIPMAPYLEINMYPFHTVFAVTVQEHLLFISPLLVLKLGNCHRNEVYILYFLSMHAGFVNPVVVFETSQRIYKKIQNIGMHKPRGCVIALNFTVACGAVWEE